MIGMDYEETKKDSQTAQYFSGSKMMQDSEVNIFISSPLLITIVGINLEIGQDSLEMEGLIFLEQLSMAIKNMNFNSKVVE